MLENSHRYEGRQSEVKGAHSHHATESNRTELADLT